jgi:hypothetical protein
MDFETLVQTRKSVRGFKQQPVARLATSMISSMTARAVVDEYPALAHPRPDRRSA